MEMKKKTLKTAAVGNKHFSFVFLIKALNLLF